MSETVENELTQNFENIQNIVNSANSAGELTPEEPVTSVDLSKPIPQYFDESTMEVGKWNDLFSRMTTNISADASIMNQLTTYLNSSNSAAIDEAIRTSNLSTLQNDYNLLKNEYTGLQYIFTTDPTAESGILDTSLNVIDRTEMILDTLENLEQYTEDIISHIETTYENLESIPGKIEETFNSFKDKLDSLGGSINISSTLEKLPELITDKLLNIDIIQDPLLLLQTFGNNVMAISTTLASIRSPQNLNDVRAMLNSMRSIIMKIKGVQNQYNRVMDSIQRLQNTLATGNYLALAISLASGGVTFFERPPSYAAQYPYNHGYTTHGGHSIERDNTPGHERMAYTHPKGTSVEVQPDGAVVIKGKNDCQLSISENFDVLVKKAATITVKGDARIIAENVNVEAKSDAIVSATGTVMVSSLQDASITAGGSVSVASKGTVTVTSALGTSISSVGPLTLSSNTAINMICESGAITTTGSIINDFGLSTILREAGTSIVDLTGGPHLITAGAGIFLN